METIIQRKLTCPVCGGEMKTLYRYGVEIDVCNDCKGVWLDRGELNKIVESVSAIYDNVKNVIPLDEENQLKEDGFEDRNYLKKVFEIDNI